jgi:LysR family transcriptional regulator for bpeEF and oprC
MLDLVLAGAGLGWRCDFMTTRSIAAGDLVEVLPRTACEETPVQALTLPGRQALPKVRVLLDLIANELKARLPATDQRS